MKLYPTQLETYENCPQKYAFSRDPDIRAKYSKSSPHLVLGNAVHDALQYFFDLSKVPVGERTYDRLCGLLRDAWAGRNLFRRNARKQAEARQQAFGGDRELEKKWGEKALNILYRFTSTQPTDAVPLTAEQFHEIQLTDDIWLGAKIDRVDRLPGGELKVIDYKTGKPPFARTEDALASSDLQLAAYALVVTRKFRGKVARCSYLFLDHDLELGYEPTEELLARKEAEIVAICERIRDDKEFAPTPNVLCPWCDYREICPRGDEWERTGGGRGPEPEDVPF